MTENSNPSSITPNPVQPFVAETNIKPSGQDTKPVEDSIKAEDRAKQEELKKVTDQTTEESFDKQAQRTNEALKDAGVPIPQETFLDKTGKVPIKDLLNNPTALEKRVSQQPVVTQSSTLEEPVQAEKVE